MRESCAALPSPVHQPVVSTGAIDLVATHLDGRGVPCLRGPARGLTRGRSHAHADQGRWARWGAAGAAQQQELVTWTNPRQGFPSPRRQPLPIAMAQPVLQPEGERMDGAPRSSAHVDAPGQVLPTVATLAARSNEDLLRFATSNFRYLVIAHPQHTGSL